MKRFGLYLLLFSWLVCEIAGAEETFPQPAELQPDVDFWVSIFTRYDSSEGVLHDSRNLSVVYERIDIPAKTGRAERRRRVKERRDALAANLRALANGTDTDPTVEQARILALWPEDVSKETLATAARSIRYQQGLSDRFREGLIRSGRWRSFIEKEFRGLGVPLELAALPHVESSYNPDARSHVGASGIWQFTRSTGRRFMRVDHVVDERNDPFFATSAAGKLLAYNYSITGNWPMAITAYNHGLSGVRRAMRRYGDTAYVDIFRKYNGRTFGFASRNFYVAFLAAKEVDQNRDAYFPDLKFEQPTDFDMAEMPAYLPAEELSGALGVTTTQLARHNPALQATVWQGSKHLPKGFGIRLPRASLTRPIDTVFAAIDPDRWQDEQLPDMFHTVARGDTLSQIAEAYDTRVSTLVALNGLGSRHRIRAGQRLRLPAAGLAPEIVAARVAAQAAAAEPVAALVEVPRAPDDLADELSDEMAVEEMTPVTMVTEAASTLMGTIQTALLSDPSDYSVADDGSIEVQPQETLGHFADWLGLRTQRLRDINGLRFRTPVDVGQRIKLEFKQVDIGEFENRRIAYHRMQQDDFFRRNVITGVSEHEIRRGESIWILSLRDYDVPIWLFRQYNPGLDMHKVTPGTTVRFPTLQTVGRD